MLKLLIAGVAVREGVIQLNELQERHQIFAQARGYADSVGKPLLVVGTPKHGFSHPYGDVTIDRVMLSLRIYTPEGKRAIRDIKSARTYHTFTLDTLDGKRVVFTKNQYFFNSLDELIFGRKLHVGDWILTREGKSRVGKITQQMGLADQFYSLRIYTYLSKYFLTNGILVGHR